MFPAGVRIDDHPSRLIVPNEDPHARRAEVAELLRAQRLAANPPHEPWPAPEIPMRVVAAGSVPSALVRPLSRLTAAGWRSVVTYCRGTSVAAYGKHGRVVDCWAIRAGKPGIRAVLIWRGPTGKLTNEGVLVWGTDRAATWLGWQQFEGMI